MYAVFSVAYTMSRLALIFLTPSLTPPMCYNLFKSQIFKLKQMWPFTDHGWPFTDRLRNLWPFTDQITNLQNTKISETVNGIL